MERSRKKENKFINFVSFFFPLCKVIKKPCTVVWSCVLAKLAVRVLLPFSNGAAVCVCVCVVEHKATSHKNFLRKRDDELLRKKDRQEERESGSVDGLLRWWALRPHTHTHTQN
jgi:hypothetical protein